MKIRILAAIAALFFSIHVVSAQVMIDPDKMVRSVDATPYMMTQSEVMIIQEKLYNLNYDLGKIDGVAGALTTAAIKKWQLNTKRQDTGILTEPEFIALSNAKVKSSVWGAVSSSTDGAYAATWNRSTRKEADDEARRDCEAKSKSPEKCVTISTTAWSSENDAWISAVHCTRDVGDVKRYHISVASASSRSESVDDAFKAPINRGTYAKSDCTLRITVEVRGRHR